MFWHRLTIHCPTCDNILPDPEVYFAADGEFLFKSLCPTCDKALQYKRMGPSLIIDAHTLDQAQEASKAVEAVISPPPIDDSYDKTFMAEVHFHFPQDQNLLEGGQTQ